jgi:hypothetical protein
MPLFKIVVTFLLFWLAVGLVGLILNSKSERGILKSATVVCVAVTAFLWLSFLWLI